jgi:putative DNA methylase
LGSVFRATILGVLLDNSQDIWTEFYKQHHFEDVVILDPFMGSGTTLGECVKLGAKPIGCDTNPVSTFLVRQALSKVDEMTLLKTFHEIEHDVKDTIQHYYKTLDPLTGETCDVLYYFWVKIVETSGGETIPLFKNYIFSKDAYPRKNPDAKILCPHCWTVNTGRYDAKEFQCVACHTQFNPQQGTATNQAVIDKHGKRYRIKELLTSTGSPPEHRLYAILAVNSRGEKVYLTPTDFDHTIFQQAQADFRISTRPIPKMEIRDGYNTKQAIGYGYQYWHQFFNGRQLLCLSVLFNRIIAIPDQSIKEHFLCLFSSTLEFNNLFCSFKGEGTGAVRHLFSHHILKPEKTPLENNVWGTKKSSGTFSTLFRSRLLRAKQYLQTPFEIRMNEKNGRKTTRKEVCSAPIDIQIVDLYASFCKQKKTALILNGDSANLPLPNDSVDAIVTDPPYFDFVHYSELSDFFYAWLQLALKDSYPCFAQDNSSHPGEVQDKKFEKFSRQLGNVFAECFRVLKKQGLMVFSFHHSKPAAWLAIYQAITTAQFTIVAAHPVKAEMSVSKTKAATHNPINLDAIIVCKKEVRQQKSDRGDSLVWENALKRSQTYYDRLEKAGRTLSRNDRYVILSSQILVYASLANLDNIETQQLLDKTYTLDLSQYADRAKQDSLKPSKNFWRKQLLTEQTSFAFIDE